MCVFFVKKLYLLKNKFDFWFFKIFLCFKFYLKFLYKVFKKLFLICNYLDRKLFYIVDMKVIFK